MSDATRDLLALEREVITNLRELLADLGADEEDFEDLRHALRDLEGLFMLVVCGEYNAGKSTFLNALLGKKVMLEGVTPTTDRVTIVTYGENEKDTEAGKHILRREYPLDILRDIALVDTPGTNAVIQQHQELTEDFIPRADLVLFVTSADRPFTESERNFLDLISSWGKKIVIIVNKLDILEDDTQREQVLTFVGEQARKALSLEPTVFGISGREALRARENNDQSALAATGLLDVEKFITESIAGNERLRLKLKSPLGVASRVAGKYEGVVKERLKLLSDDKRTLQEVERQCSQFEHDMKRDFEGHLGRIKTVLLEVERRGEVFFDDTVRIEKLFKLMQTEKVKEEFKTQVIRGADKDIDNVVGETVDWFIERNLQVWEDVMAFVQERRQASQDKVIGEIGGRFSYDRDNLIRNLRQSAEDVLSTFDEQVEASRLADSLQGTAVSGALVGIGGVGLGAAMVAILSTVAWDITGVLAGTTLASLGLVFLPIRRRIAKRELHKKMQELRDGLAERLSKQFHSELQKANERLINAVSPYTRFVRSELGRLEGIDGELANLKGNVDNLKRQVEDLAL